MSGKTRIAVVLSVCLFAATCGSVWAEAKDQVVSPEPVMDQRALDILQKMSDALSNAKTMRFQARSMIPFETSAGVWINMYGISQVVMQGPDKLFVSTSGDLAPHDFYFDGKTVTLYSPAKNLYAIKSAPPAIDAMFEEAYNEEGKSFPFADILVSNPYAVLAEGLAGALYVGQSTIRPLSGAGSVETDHLVFSNKDVEWQIWIDTKDRLPRMVCATYLDTVNEPSYTVEFGDWKLDEPVGADIFVFKNTTNASKIDFRYPSQGGKAGPRDAASAKTAEGV
jgi:hypothetical protein